VAVFTSLKPEDVLAEAEGASRGRRALRQYLEYARSGRLETGAISGRSADSDFEDLVRQRLGQAGYEVDCQVGVAGYFVDLGVRHPARKSHYILGVECDGATYHSFKSARDRDRLRQEILEGLGWKIHRIWSTDWFQNPDAEIRRLVERLKLEEKSSLSEETVQFDWKRFSAPATDWPQNTSGATKSEESTLGEDETRGRSTGLKLPLADVETYLVGLRSRAEDKVLAAFQRAVDFSDGSPRTIEIDTLRSGTQRMMVLEELYNRAAFQWISDHRGSPLGGLPWVSNLTVGENLHLREFAITALLKTGRL
jgi:very-short-patch-repair endonuclease